MIRHLQSPVHVATVRPSIASRSCSSQPQKTQTVSLTPYNTTFNELLSIQMVLRRLIETTAVTGQVVSSFR
jgi:hypothetical protein